MKTIHKRLAVLTAVALGTLAVLVPPAPATPVDPPPPKPPVTSPVPPENPEALSVFAGTAIGVVLEANGNEVPKNGVEMMRALSKVGTFVQLPVGFSAVSLHSGLTNPRVVIAHKPTMLGTGATLPDGRPDPSDFSPNGPSVAPLSKGKLTTPSLEGRLYLAANMEKVNGTLKVKVFEFISWNSRQKRFDFGFIECDDVEPQIRIVDGVKCASCHKNKGPILGQGPWSNTTHNDVMRAAVAQSLSVDEKRLCLPVSIGQPRTLLTGLEQGIVRSVPNTEFDGMSLLIPQGPAVDAAVRQGAENVRDREILRLMTGKENEKSDARKGLVHLLGAIVAPGPIEQTNAAVIQALNADFNPTFYQFSLKAEALHKSSSSTLLDNNTSGSTGKLVNVITSSPGGWGSGPVLQSNLKIVWSGDVKTVIEHDTKRSEGIVGVLSKFQPSNPAAFAVPSAISKARPSNIVSAQQLARVIGLTEGDRVYLADLLATAAQKVNKPKTVTTATLARDVFGGPEFTAVLVAAQLPDREDFKDRFVTSLNRVLSESGVEPLDIKRSEYASGPNVALVPGKEDKEPTIVATTACIRCHDLQQPGKSAFSPIPQLAFDPFNKESRETWAKATNAQKRAQVLGRLVQRVGSDSDMPPKDSAEYEAFRTKNPAEFDAMKDWLIAELKKTKGD